MVESALTLTMMGGARMAKDRTRQGRPPRGPDLSLEQLQEAREAHCSGAATLQQLADRHGVSRWRLDQLLGSIGYERLPVAAPPPEPARRRITLDDILDAKERYEAGECSAAIAAELGITRQYLRVLLRGVGYSPRPKGSPRAFKAPRRAPARQAPLPVPVVLEDARRGFSPRQIAERWHLPPARVCMLLAKAGLMPDAPAASLEPTRRQVVDLQRLLPRLSIPQRTRLERRRRAWSATEQTAIERELAAGRVLDVPRGFRGLAGGLSLHNIFRTALPPLSVPNRSAEERTGRQWSPAEADAIARELHTGRARAIPPSQRQGKAA